MVRVVQQILARQKLPRFMHALTRAMVKNPSIIIIGAGVAGISAAKKLIEHGLTNLTILEASNRLGGRIKSVDFEGAPIELGAQWCHGQEDNVVYDLVKDLKLLDVSFNTYFDHVFYDSKGRQIDKALTDELFQIFTSVCDGIEESKDIRGSFGEHFIECYHKEVARQFRGENQPTCVAKCMLDWFHKFVLCYESSPSWFDLSVGGNDGFVRCGGHQLLHWKGKGFGTLIDVLMNEYPQRNKSKSFHDKIAFNKNVCKIDWSNLQNGVGKFSVLCKDNTSFEADHVILTVSLGVLKEKHKELFQPALPPYKQSAIEGLSIGRAGKIFLKFPLRWWPVDCPGFSLIWQRDDAMNVLNDFPHGPSSNGRSWLEDLFGFYVIDSDPNTLLGWIVGEHVSEVELLPDEIILSGCVYLLNKFLGDTFTIPTPENILCSKWSSDPLYRGSWSYHGIESDRKNVSINQLAEPIKLNNIPRLLFAGEATHSKYFSTVHGAIESGFREAERLIDLYTGFDERKYSVAVIGAGIAGLGAAHTLLEAGFSNIVVLEALNEVGGRIRTLNVGEGVIELGAQWLHGTGNALFEIADHHNLILPEKSLEGLGLYIRDDGYVFDNFFVQKVDFEIGQIIETCKDFVESEAYPISFGDYLEEKFSDLTNNDKLDDATKQMKWELYDWHVRFQLIDNSCKNLKNVSAKEWGKYLCISKDGQEYLNIKHGYKALIDVIIKSFPEGTVKLNTPVVKINYGEDGVKLNCEDNSLFWADHVIVTSSIGVLQQGLVQFTPVLPRKLSSAISNLGFHGIGKIFLVFETKWWDGEGFQIIWRRDTVIDVDRKWTQYITGFDAVLNQPNMLLGWVGGDGVEVMESLPEDVVGKHCIDLLRKFLKNDAVPYPIKIFRSSWTSCPWIRGGYSHTTPASDKSGLGPSALSTPVAVNGIPRILFAGEATHPNHFSTTYGGYESGKQQAQNLIKFFKKHDNHILCE